jgi:hypothetical protein
MRYAIQVRYLGATNHRGARMKAWAFRDSSATVALDHNLTIEANARAACNALVAKMGWPESQLIFGHLPNGDFVFVAAPFTVKEPS